MIRKTQWLKSAVLLAALTGLGATTQPALATTSWGIQEAGQDARALTADDARQMQGANRFDEAIRAWEAVAERDPANGEAWFNLGYCLHMEGRLEEALAIHTVAVEFDQFHGIALYNVGCANALLGNPDEAFAALFASSQAGFDVAGNAPDDSDLNSLHDDPRFAALLSGSAGPAQQRGADATPQSMGGSSGGPADIMTQVHQTVVQIQQMLEYQWPSIREQIMMTLDQAAVQAQQALKMVQHELENNPQIAAIAQMIQQRMGGGPQAGSPAPRPATSRPQAEATSPPAATRVPQAAVDAAVPAPTLAAAQQLQGQEQWAGAIAMYAGVLESQPDNVAARFGHAYCLHMNGDYEKAIQAHKKAATYDQTRGIATYNLACAYALTGSTTAAIEALHASHAAGFDLSQQIHSDSDLDSLRDDSRFKALLRELEGDGGTAK